MAKGLTEKQSKILEFIIDFQKENGFPPTIREMGDAFGIGSLRGVTVHLDALVRKGFVTRDRTSRSIRVVGPDPRTAAFSPSSPVNAAPTNRVRLESVLLVPLIRGFSASDKALMGGKTSMGEALIERYISLPDELATAATEEGFVIRVGATGIYGEPALPGDLLVVRPQHTAGRGELIVSLFHGDLCVARHEGRISEAGEESPVAIVPTEEPDIIGRVVGMIRRY